jgi:hypothetical protein
MAPVCREFGIFRVTGYKIFECYKACGLDGLYDRSKAPYRQAKKPPFQVERAIWEPWDSDAMLQVRLPNSLHNNAGLISVDSTSAIRRQQHGSILSRRQTRP